MGTRSVVCVFKDKEPKIAQYNHHDSQPKHLGTEILALIKEGWHDLKRNVDRVRLVEGNTKHSSLTGDEALAHVINLGDRETIELEGYLDFGYNSVPCEYAYVVDFDYNTFEVYAGGNKTKLKEGDRWHKLTPETTFDGKKFWGVKLVAFFHLDSLPSEDEFIKKTRRAIAQHNREQDLV